jgi:hypothetical protein
MKVGRGIMETYQIINGENIKIGNIIEKLSGNEKKI